MINSRLNTRRDIRTQAHLSVAYIAKMALVTDGVVRHYEEGTLLESIPRGVSPEKLQKRLDCFYDWLKEMPLGGESPHA